MIKQLKIKLALIVISSLLIPLVSSAVVYTHGRGIEGDLTLSGARNESDQATSTPITVLTTSSATITVSYGGGYAAGDYVLIHQTLDASDDTGTGYWEVARVGEISGNDLILKSSLINIYGATGAQVVKINEYHDVTIESGGAWTVDKFDNLRGGILVAMISGDLVVESGGAITVQGKGFDGGASRASDNCIPSWQGGGHPTNTGASSQAANGVGGGGGDAQAAQVCGGAGGGHISAGSNSGVLQWCVIATGGTAFATSMSLATTTSFGGGGGGGHECNASPTGASQGGDGGGIIYLFGANDFDFSGADAETISAEGGDVSDQPADGGGAAGGSIYLLPHYNLILGTSDACDATSGSTQGNAGGGAHGRVRTIDEATVTGDSSPTIEAGTAISTDRIYNLDQDAIQINLGLTF